MWYDCQRDNYPPKTIKDKANIKKITVWPSTKSCISHFWFSSFGIGLHFVARTSVSHGHILLFVTEQYYSNCPELPLVPPTSPYHSKLN